MEGIKEEEPSPLFSHFLSIKRFLLLYGLGFLVMLGNAHLYLIIGTKEFFAVNLSLIGTILFAILAPIAYYFANFLLSRSRKLFKSDSQSEEITYLFSEEDKFKQYRQKVLKTLNSKHEKTFALGTAFLIWLPISIFNDYQKGFLQSVMATGESVLAPLEYFSFFIYFAAVGSLLFSGIWMILTVTKALLDLKKEKPHLHISHSIEELHGLLKSSGQKKLPRAKMELLELSFGRFKAGLSSIADFVIHISLMIALISGLYSLPALVLFIITNQVDIVWYGVCICAVTLSVAVYVVGQFGAWRLWDGSKKEATKLLNLFCKIRTDSYTSSKHPRKSEVEEDIKFVKELTLSINSLSNVTYTTSAVIKVASANALAFGPMIIQQILTHVVFK